MYKPSKMNNFVECIYNTALFNIGFFDSDESESDDNNNELLDDPNNFVDYEMEFVAFEANSYSSESDPK